jgi:hypothetical protein
VSEVHPVPDGTGEAGRRLWHAVVDDFELAEHELALLRQAVAVADACEALQEAVDRDGLVVAGRPNALLTELRMQRILLARLVVALRVPIGDAEDEGRTQRRGVRGVYALRSVPS